MGEARRCGSVGGDDAVAQILRATGFALGRVRRVDFHA